MTIELRPYQMRGFEKALARADKRLALAHEMSAGKSYVELAWLEELQPERYLLVVDAAVRPMWHRLLVEHFPNRDIGVILRGRNVKALSGPEAARRAAYYAAPWQIVSYDLLSDVSLCVWNRITGDEAHHLRAPNSQQSKDYRAIMRSNPKASGALLSGTFIPNEVRQLWNPLDTLFPNWYGPIVKRGSSFRESWDFLDDFCEREVNRYGTRHFGSKKETLQDLQNAIAPYVDRVVQSDFAQYLPDLFVESYPSSAGVESVVREWASNINSEITHWGIFTHLRQTAEVIGARCASYGSPVVIITGAESPEKRDELLRQAASEERAIVVGTTASLAVGISLSFLKAALVVEWTSSVDNILQFTARFARQDSATKAPTRVSFLIGPNDESRMETVRERVAAMNSVFKAGRSEGLAAQAFADRPMSDDEFTAVLSNITAGIQKRAATRGLIEVEDDDDSET